MAKKPTGSKRTPDRPKAPAPVPAQAQAPGIAPKATVSTAAQGRNQTPATAAPPPAQAAPATAVQPQPAAQASIETSPGPSAASGAKVQVTPVAESEAAVSAFAPAPAPTPTPSIAPKATVPMAAKRSDQTPTTPPPPAQAIPATAVQPQPTVQASIETSPGLSAASGAKVQVAKSETAVPAPAPAPVDSPTPAAGSADSPPVPAWADPNPVPPTIHDLGPEAASEPRPEPVPEVIPAPTPGPIHHEAPAVRHEPSLFVVQITPEMAPIAKVGGLADVVFGLSRELAIRGNQVEIILPKYDNLRYDHIFGLHEVYRDLWVPWYDGAIHCTVYFGLVHDRKCFFIEPHSKDNFFNRGAIYGFNDDVLRFAFFSRAAMEFLWKAGKHPDIIHCHDWQTALIPVLLFEMFQRLGMTHPRVCLTIHNFAHQGVTSPEVLRATGLHQPQRFLDYNRLRDNRYVNALNLLKGGIVYSNFVTTVSPRYAFETKDQGQGFGLEPTLHTHHMKYGGVVNGIDYDVWNPEVDHLLPVRYGVDSIDGKYANKAALRHRLMLADNHKPIVAFIGRLDPQKGLELLRHAIFYTLERGGQFVLLGSSPDPRINADFWGLKQMLNDSPDCHLEIGFDEELSHLIYAGSDIMLVPSRFEPCGLTQLISLRYGTIPVVRSVGGLADTVFDKDHSTRPLHERNGYVFEHYDNAGLESALERAIACYFKYPEHFRALMQNAMRTDYSWNHPGQDYLNIYDYIRDK